MFGTWCPGWPVSIYLSKLEQDKDVVTTEYIFQVIQHTAEHK